MRMCGLQLERGEKRELAPIQGAAGPISLSGGAITTIAYSVFDKDADRLDKKIKAEPWRAFAAVVMRITLERDPEFEVTIDGKPVDARPLHKAPGLTLVARLSEYFPLLARPYRGPTFSPEVAA